MRIAMIAIVAAMLVAGCHGKVIETKDSARVERQLTESCTHSDWCHRCTGSGDKRSCGWGFSMYCPGVRSYLAETWVETSRYEDGYVGNSNRSRKLRNLTSCQ